MRSVITGFCHRRGTGRVRGRSARAVAPRAGRPAGLLAAVVLLLAFGMLGPLAAVAGASRPHHGSGHDSGVAARGADDQASKSATVWLCRPGMPHDPCAAGLTTTVVDSSGAISVEHAKDETASMFDCFYVYPTVSTETTPNADLRLQTAEIDTAIAQASRFSTVCKVWAPMYRQITLSRLFALPLLTASSAPSVTAYDSLRAGFESYLNNDNANRPIVFIGHSQGASMLIRLLQHLVDNNPKLRARLVLAIILGGNVVVPTGSLTGGSFAHIPVCSSPGQAGCVVAYSTFPSQPPASTFFGRPGQGVSMMAGQTAKAGMQVVCVNPAAIGGKSATLEPFFPSEGKLPTRWVEFPDLYSARCKTADGTTWLQVTKVSGPSDPRPVVTEKDGPDWGYHEYDVNLALGNLLADTAAAEATWSKGAHR
ncbi:MAG: DUF3089 domain-containing protein [Acidimicrobiales bacterium]|jgi:hypothetical protein